MASDQITRDLAGVIASAPTAYVNFRLRLDGPPPSPDDTGNIPVIAGGGFGTPAVMAGGKLTAVPPNNSAFSTYYQIPLGADGLRVGCEFTVGANDGGVTAAALILWDHPITGSPIPQARTHWVISPGLGAWFYAVIDGTGGFVQVDSGFFTPLAYDGVTVWHADVCVDPATNDVHLFLPDGSVATIKAAKIATAIAGYGPWSAGNTLTSLSGKYATLEHFAGSNGLINIAAFPKFTAFWAETTATPAYARTTGPLQVAKAVSNMALGDPHWTVPTLLNGWTNPGGTETVGYRKHASGVVEIRGYVTAAGGFAPVFTLPVGYRPATGTTFRPVVTDINGVATISITTAGDVTPNIGGPRSCWLSAFFDTTP